jgi:NAD(P)-dependent dehydrogenase (short-subunit alcohol dehydrogenase family)
MKLDNATVFITGANRGLGLAFAREVLARGARKVYAAARDPRRLDSVVKADPRCVVAIELDVTDPEQIRAAAAHATDVNLLINNAGVLASFDILNCSVEQLERDFAVNFYGKLAMVRAFLPVLERAHGAAIANVLTVVSLASRPVIGGYAASKAAAFSMTQSLRPALKAKQIDVHTVVPGAVDTDMIRDFPIEKANPEAVATAIVAGIDRGDEDIVTDGMAGDVYARWLKNPKELERYFATL